MTPTRGAQGNALKTILAMGSVLTGGKESVTTIESQGVLHTIKFSIDPIDDVPVIDHGQEDYSEHFRGTKVFVRWPQSVAAILDHPNLNMAYKVWQYAWLNPHLKISFSWRRGEPIDLNWTATDIDWKRWSPNQSMPPHW